MHMADLKAFSDAAKGLSRNPLGIIALFIVLIYGFAALTLGTTSTLQPQERLPLVWFMVIFPVIVLFTFAWLVSRHHEKLYAPADYHSDDAFLKGLEVRARHAIEIQTQQNQLKARVRDAVIASTVPLGTEKKDFSGLLQKISEEIDRSTTITVDAREFLGNDSAEFILPVAAYETLGDLTNDLYFRLNNKVRAYEYGFTWVLRNEDSGQVVKNARMITQSRSGSPVPDRRTLAEVGITPGTRLIVQAPGASNRSIQRTASGGR
jgi:hypothetical protein